MSEFQRQVEEWRQNRDAAADIALTKATEAPAPEILQSDNFSVIVRLRPLLAAEKEKITEASQAAYARASAAQIADFECVTLRGNAALVHQEDRQGVALMGAHR